MSEVEFVGTPGGDNECFVWDVDKETYIEVVGQEYYDRDREFVIREYEEWPEGMEAARPIHPDKKTQFRLYPNDIIEALGSKYGKRCRFKISVEEI